MTQRLYVLRGRNTRWIRVYKTDKIKRRSLTIFERYLSKGA